MIDKIAINHTTLTDRLEALKHLGVITSVAICRIHVDRWEVVVRHQVFNNSKTIVTVVDLSCIDIRYEVDRIKRYVLTNYRKYLGV